MDARKRRSDEVVSELLLAELVTIRANVDGAIAGEDPEALHQLRVSLRRSRTLLKGMPGVFATTDRERFTRDFKELQSITGPVRDYDVLLEDLESFNAERPELALEAAALRTELLRKRSAARSRLKRRLGSKRFTDLLDSWQTMLEALPSADEEARPDAAAPIGKLARKRISADRRRFDELSGAALKTGEASVVHHARRRGKALRYNLEFFGRLENKKKSEHLGRRLKKIQDELGAYQDTVVREAALHDAAESAGSVAAATAAGALIERSLEERDYRLMQFGRRVTRLKKK